MKSADHLTRLQTRFLCPKLRSLVDSHSAHNWHTTNVEVEGRLNSWAPDSQSWFCSGARVAETNSGTQLAHYFVRGHGFAVELGRLSFTSEKRVYQDQSEGVTSGLSVNR